MERRGRNQVPVQIAPEKASNCIDSQSGMCPPVPVLKLWQAKFSAIQAPGSMT